MNKNSLIFREHAAGMEEEQVLKYILSLSKRGETETLCAALLETFGTLKNVLESSTEQLETVPGIGKRTAEMITAFLPTMRVYERLTMEQQQTINNRKALEQYCKSLVFGLNHEEFFVICVNSQCKVLGTKRIATGTINEVHAFPRLIVQAALNYNAHSVFLCHNHPGGTCSPSREDINTTLEIKRILKAIDILVLDHMIIAGNTGYSMSQNGDIDFCR